MAVERVLIIGSDGSSTTPTVKPIHAAYAVVAKLVDIDTDTGDINIISETIIKKFLPDSTNNKAELRGYKEAIKFLYKSKLPIDTKVVFVLDSQYTMKSVHEWYDKWIKNEVDGVVYKYNKYTNQYGKVKNWNIIKSIRELMEKVMEKGYEPHTLLVRSHLSASKIDVYVKNSISAGGPARGALTFMIYDVNRMADGCALSHLEMSVAEHNICDMYDEDDDYSGAGTEDLDIPDSAKIICYEDDYDDE